MPQIPSPKNFALGEHYATEDGLKKAVFGYLTSCPQVAWARRFNTGAHVVRGQNGSRRYIRYAFPGCSDFLGQLRTGQFLAIETKHRSRKPSPEQLEFIETVNAAGGLGVVAYTIGDVADAIAQFYAFPRE